jgi:hypothetical protein
MWDNYTSDSYRLDIENLEKELSRARLSDQGRREYEYLFRSLQVKEKELNSEKEKFLYGLSLAQQSNRISLPFISRQRMTGGGTSSKSKPKKIKQSKP